MAEPTHRSTDEARAATTPHVTRYVLAIGLTLVVIVLGLVFIWGVGTGPEPDGNAVEDRSGSLDTPPSLVTPGTAHAPTTSATPGDPIMPQTNQAQSQEGPPQ